MDPNPPARLTKRHAEVLGDCLEKPAELFMAITEALRYLHGVSALTLTADQLFRMSANRANWSSAFVDALCVGDEGAVEQAALSLIELRTL